MLKKIILLAVFSLVMFLPVFVSAVGLNDATTILDSVAGTDKTGLSGNLADTIATVIKTVLALVGTIFLVLTIYAGILWMTAQGNDEQVTKATGIIKASVIGLIIIMSAYAITFFVTSRLVGAAGTANQSVPPPPSYSCSQATGQATCIDISPSQQCFWDGSQCINM